MVHEHRMGSNYLEHQSFMVIHTLNNNRSVKKYEVHFWLKYSYTILTQPNQKILFLENDLAFWSNVFCKSLFQINKSLSSLIRLYFFSPAPSQELRSSGFPRTVHTWPTRLGWTKISPGTFGASWPSSPLTRMFWILQFYFMWVFKKCLLKISV